MVGMQEAEGQGWSFEGAKLQELLNIVGLSLDKLPLSAIADIKTLAGIAKALQLSSGGSAQLIAAVAQLQLKLMKCSSERASQDASLSQLKAQSMVAADLLVEMQDLLKQMQDSCDSKKDLVQQQQTESRGLGRKLAQYMQQVQRMQKQLASVGYSPELRHGALVERSAKLEEKQHMVVVMHAKLDKFLSLPPDMDAAQKIVESKLQKLRFVRKQLDEGFESL